MKQVQKKIQQGIKIKKQSNYDVKHMNIYWFNNYWFYNLVMLLLQFITPYILRPSTYVTEYLYGYS